MTPPDADSLHRLLISCDDRRGIVAAVSGFLAAKRANIVVSDQHSTDPLGGSGRFFMRTAFTLELERGERAAFEAELNDALGGFDPRLNLFHAADRKRIAVLASREDHCLADLLWRARRGEFEGDVALVASNHPDLAGEVSKFEVPYHHVPVTKERKAESESQLLELLAADPGVDVVVLARYMQILSGDFLERVGVPVINIHHSFLPAFAGADPYRQAKDRGVKLIGATAHYVTEELDAGPIIEQGVERVGHREDVGGLIRLGADIERAVLARAVRWHCEDRVLLDGETTVVF